MFIVNEIVVDNYFKLVYFLNREIMDECINSELKKFLYDNQMEEGFFVNYKGFLIICIYYKKILVIFFKYV